jgi:O-antigen/teichoic acid export membrane protein
MQLLKSIASVGGSYVLTIVLVIMSDPLLHALFPKDYVRGKPIPDTLLWLSTAIFVVVSILCAWICAKTAPGKVLTHIVWFFAIGEIMGLVTTCANWGKMPHWYSVAWLLVWIPAVWIGWRLARR